MLGSRRWKRSKIRLCSSGAIPIPSSRTVKRMAGPARSRRTSIRPPSGEYLIAFSIRLTRICRSLSGSAVTCGIDDSPGNLPGVDRIDVERLAVGMEAAGRERIVEEPREAARLVGDH